MSALKKYTIVGTWIPSHYLSGQAFICHTTAPNVKDACQQFPQINIAAVFEDWHDDRLRRNS